MTDKKANVLKKYGGQITQAADRMTMEETDFKQGTPEFINHRDEKIRDIIRDSFGIIAKPSGKWQHDHGYFFNRRSEMGFIGDRGTNIVAGLFGRELFDLIYPGWWGGQGKVSQGLLTEKVNNKVYEPGSNFAKLISRPGWDNLADTRDSKTFTNTLEAPVHVQEHNLEGTWQQGTETRTTTQYVPHSTSHPIKTVVDPVTMQAAGVPTHGFGHLVKPNPFDPNTFYGFDGLINGGGQPIHPHLKPHPYTPPPHIPQMRDPTLRSLYA